MKGSLKTFMKSLIDYAGLFPPAKLPLKDAIKEYAQLLESENSWMLGRFIIPISNLNELDEFLPLFKDTGPLRLSVLGGGGESEKEYLKNIKENVSNIKNYRQKHGDKIEIEVIECKMPTVPLTEETVNQATATLNQNNLYHFPEFNELPYVGINYSTDEDESDWDDNILPTIELLSKIDNAGMKLRCGGITKEAFPSVEQVAAMIQTCAIKKIPLKFTAGLHHPIRHFADEYDEYMHGFINTFTASIFASTFPIPKTDQEKFRMFILLSHMIDDQTPENFSFEEEKIIWQVRDDRETTFELTSENITNARKENAISYGSCSFEEPIDDLTELGWM